MCAAHIVCRTHTVRIRLYSSGLNRFIHFIFDGWLIHFYDVARQLYHITIKRKIGSNSDEIYYYMYTMRR